MLQVTTVGQAIEAAKRGVDVIIAQGSEAGGYCGNVSTMALISQVVDAVSPIPVVAAGAIFDGRGIAAALVLGAAGVNLGTRFLASEEAPIPEEWKKAIIAAESEDAMKADVLNDISPLPGTAGYHTVLRSLHTPFLDEWSAKREEARRERDRLRNHIVSTHQSGRQHETLLTAGARPPEASPKSCPWPRSCVGSSPRLNPRYRGRRGPADHRCEAVPRARRNSALSAQAAATKADAA